MFGLGGGGGNPYEMLGKMGQQFMQRGQPRLVGQQPAAAPQMFSPGVMAGPYGSTGMNMGSIPPEMLQRLQGLLGPQSQAGWGMGTTVTPSSIPLWLQGLLQFRR